MQKIKMTVRNVDGTTTTRTVEPVSMKLTEGGIQVEPSPGFYQYAERVEIVE